MAQEHKLGPAAAAKTPPEIAAPSEAAAKPAASAMPPALPSSDPSRKLTPSDFPDTLAFLSSANATPNLGSPAATVNHKMPPPLPNMARGQPATPPLALPAPAGADKPPELSTVEPP